MGESYTGEVRTWAVSAYVPKGWAACQGQLLPINSHQALFSLLGTRYGGDGKTTFGLPDLRGRVALHADGGAYQVGARGGEELHSLVLEESPIPHGHLVNSSSAVANSNLPDGKVLAATGLNGYAQPNPPVKVVPGTIATAGGTGHENRAPYQVIGYYICLDGVFPTPGGAEEATS